MPIPNVGEEDSCDDADDEGGENLKEELPVDKSYNRKARVAVSAEAVGVWNHLADWQLPRHLKSVEQRTRLLEILQTSFLFSSLDRDDQEILAEAMEEVRVTAASVVINKGEDGNFLFVVEEGRLECFTPASVENNEVENVLKICHSGDVFGELSLLYNAPRAASVRAIADCVLWKLDRQTFTYIVRDRASVKRQKHVEFLTSVPILSKIGSYELSQIADALKLCEFGPNETIVTEGDTNADIFYILETGTADAFKSGLHVLNYQHPGDYFGELALIRDEPRAATVLAGPSGCSVLQLNRGAFKRLLGSLEDFIQKHY